MASTSPPPTTFNPAERALLAALADVFIPAADGFPPASAAGVAGPGLDSVLSVRPDLTDGLKRLLGLARGRSPHDAIAELKKTDPTSLGILTELVPAAYFLNADVRARLSYEGQTPRPIDLHPDYLDDDLLRSVINRGPVYRPTPNAKSACVEPLPHYNWNESYDWNYTRVPGPVTVEEPTMPGAWDFCGLPVSSPLGIAAGPLLNGRWILYYATLGFDVLTYKTVRSTARASYPMPNLQPVLAQPLGQTDTVLRSTSEMLGTWAVSFGMPSKSPEVWRKDVETTRSALPKHKILSVSVVATPEESWTIDQLAADFARCAKWAAESGADCVEANFSCPNVASLDGQLYQQPAVAARVAAELRQAIGPKPLLLKIGHVTDELLAAELARSVAPYSNALVMVNCISAQILAPDQQLLFDGQKRGIAGEAIRSAALSQIHLFNRIIRRLNLSLSLVGVGGIATADHVQAHLQAGSHAVQLATAPMLDPTVGLKIRHHLLNPPHAP